MDCRDGSYDIYGFNCSTGEEFSITTNEGKQQSPAIYEYTVVWEDNRNGNWDIYGFNIVSPLEITSASRTGTILLHSLVTVLIVVLKGVNLFLVGLNIAYLKKGTLHIPSTEDRKPHYWLFFVIGLVYAPLGVAHLCIARPYFGVMWLTVSAIWSIGIVKSFNKLLNPSE